MWSQIPFKDDYTPLYQSALNGVRLLQRGSVVGWNWWLMGGYPTSTDIAQSFGALAFVPTVLFGPQIGYHVLHAIAFLAVPSFVWWDISQENAEEGALAAAFAFLLTAGYFATIGNSGDTNSLIGVFCASVAMVGSRAARLGRRWGAPVLMLGLTMGLYAHVAFCVYAGIFVLLEAAYYRDLAVVWRLAVAGFFAILVAMPVHWESLRYHSYVSFNNTVYDPGAPFNWPLFVRTIGYNVEILALPQRWFNDYRSLANVWLPVLLVMALAPGRVARGLLRLRGRSDAGAASREHLGGRRAVRSDPAHDPAAGRTGPRRLRAPVRRHAPAGIRSCGIDRPVRCHLVRTGPSRARPAGLRRAADRPYRRGGRRARAR